MAGDRASKEDRLRRLRAEFAAGLPHRMAQIRKAAEPLQTDAAGALAPDGLLRRLVHNLSGAGGTFGYARLSQASKRLDEDLIALAGQTEPSERDIMRITEQLEQLDLLVQRGPADEPFPEAAPPAASAREPERRTLVYILDDEPLLAREIAQQLQHFGYEGVACGSGEELRKAFRRARPDVLISDIRLPEGPLEGPRVVAEIQKDFRPPIPTVFLSIHSNWQARLAALRAGGVAYLPKPVDMTALVAELDRVTGRHLESPFRVLLVDDEPLLARFYATILQEGGMEAEILDDPTLLLDRLTTFSPDLLLLDLYMPACTGLELARVVRQAATYTHLPIVFLSSERSREEQLAALREGGDDFIEKPVPPAHLLGAIAARASRFRALRALMNRDALTGLLNHTHLKLALDRELAISQRQGRPLCHAMLDIDHFKQVNDTYGHPVGDRVIKGLSRLLAQRLRKGDIVGRYGGEEFAIVLPDASLSQGAAVLDQLRADFSALRHLHSTGSFSTTFSAGIAQATTGCSMESLIEAADAALYQAKREGRNRVAASGLSAP